jgi:hypothetical protein
MKTTIRAVENTIKENREECMLMGGDVNGRQEKEKQEIEKRRGRMGKENPKTR